MTNPTSQAIQELMTGTGIKNRMIEITERCENLKGESQWKSELADLCRLQAEEIDRLNATLEDAASVPPRRPLLATVSSTTLSNGMARDTVLVIDDHSDLWMTSDPTRSTSSWSRLPRLPVPVEITKTLKTPREIAEKQAAAEAKAREAEMARVNGWRRS
jgi:hypothetical protein